MFSKSVKMVPVTIRIVKALAVQNSKQYYGKINSRYIAPSFAPQKCIARRTFSTQLNVEDMTVDYDHVKQATLDKKTLIIDVREPEEIKEHGKIPNSVNIPLGSVATVLGTMTEREFEQNYKRVKPSEDTEIIFYCMIGKRSGMAQQNAFNLGYKNVKNYLGSWIDWSSKSQ